MCGRFTLRVPAADWCQLFLIDVDDAAEQVERPRYNIAPTQEIAAVVRESTGEPNQLTRFRWGLLPPWAKEFSVGARMINARSETVDEKPSFRKAFAERRCLIPADGYLEWKRAEDGKQPYLAHRPDNVVFAMAGLYETNTRLADAPIQSCTILTTRPNGVTGQIHDRMPVILRPDDYDRWLDPGFRDTDQLKPLLTAPEDEYLRLTAVSRRVNNARHDDAECLASPP